MFTFPTKARCPILLQMSASKTLESLWIVAKYTEVVVPASKVERTHLQKEIALQYGND